MSNINKYVNNFSQKRDLSDESNLEEDGKAAREGSSTTSNNDATEDEVSQQFSITNDIWEVLEYHKILEGKISEIYNLRNDIRPMEIKGDKKLANMTKLVKLMWGRFDEFEKNHKEKEKIRSNLNQDVYSVKKRVESLEKVKHDHMNSPLEIIAHWFTV